MPPWWSAVLESCLRRIRTWCPPPNCSAHDWMEEMGVQARAAACQALRDYDTVRGVPLPAFVHQRVLAGALTRYRQEWAFALRCVPEAEVAIHPLSPPAVCESLRQALA